MKRYIALMGCLMGSLAVAVLPARAGGLEGVWLTGDAASHVRFSTCGTATCGEIVWLRDPLDPATGKPWLDKFNPDEAAKKRTLLGVVLIKGLQEKQPGNWEGQLYNPADGRTYSGIIRKINESALQLKGCALAGLICQTETWKRVTQ